MTCPAAAETGLSQFATARAKGRMLELLNAQGGVTTHDLEQALDQIAATVREIART